MSLMFWHTNAQKLICKAIRKKYGTVGHDPDHGELEDEECWSGQRGRERVAVWWVGWALLYADVEALRNIGDG